VIAGAVASFYHARGEAANMPRCAVLASLRRALLYNMGSVAIGSFLVALLQFVRWALAWVARRAKPLQRGAVRPPPVSAPGGTCAPAPLPGHQAPALGCWTSACMLAGRHVWCASLHAPN
jgi:hypothetical protein